MKVGFIGLGIMGKPMSKNLIKAGYSLIVNDVNTSAVAELMALGAESAENAAEVARRSDLVITMLPNSPHVRQVVLGKNGLIEGARPGLILIDMSSIAPLASKEVKANWREGRGDAGCPRFGRRAQGYRRHSFDHGRRQ